MLRAFFGVSVCASRASSRVSSASLQRCRDVQGCSEVCRAVRVCRVCCRRAAGVLQVRLCARGRKHRLGEITPRCTPRVSSPLPSSEAPVPVRVGRDTGETTPSLGLVGETTPKALETREASSLPTLCGEW